jgi:serine/threonine-protein kinase
VALKALPPELASATNGERFLREIRITSRLDHPNILALVDSGATGRHYWYAMPLVEGESLRARLRTGPLTVAAAIALGRQTASALGYAHSHGVVHRDLKAENLMWTGDGWVVLAFGLARALQTDVRLTGANMPLGTPAYMSPEQITAAGEVDERTDLYGLGCVLFEAVTGRPPFIGPTIVHLLRAQLQGAPPAPSTLAPEGPAGFARLVLQARAQAPADRQAPAAALLAELDALAASAPPAPVERRSGLFNRLFGR